MAGKKLTLTSVGGRKVNAPKGTKTVTQNAKGNLVYKDKKGNAIKKASKKPPTSFKPTTRPRPIKKG
jgi:hypothetical protein